MASFVLPICATAQTYGAWQFGKIDGVCAVASRSIDANDARSFNIMVTNDDRILLYIVLGEEVPPGARQFGIQVAEQVYWQIGFVEDGILLFDLSTHPESSQILAEIIDGSTLNLMSGLGDVAAQFSLRGSGQAIAQLARCASEGQ